VQRKTLTAFVYLLAAVADSWLLVSRQPLNQPSKFDSALCFLAALLFAAAGFVLRRTHFAHIYAVAGVVALPWLYTTTLHGNIYVNHWIVFNVPDRELPAYNGLITTELTIISVALVVLGITTGALRLLPDRWVLRRKPIGERTWPAVAASFCFLAAWFSQSVMPYRIPGALDYSSWPILQILHVQKYGLQFHETCIRVWGHGGLPESVSSSGNDRRLFEYRFQQRFAHVEGPKLLRERVAALIQSSKIVKSHREPIEPLRRWNDEGWYVAGEEVELQAYTKENQATPPQEVVDLFHDFEKVSRTQETSEDRKDVCLGFCYDPLSGLGALYANHRCSWEDTHVVCR
jgi:hypothetical protein